MKRKHNLKLPNGFGSIVYLGENRRKPYGVLKTVGWNEDGKQIKKYIGYAESWNQAYQMLLEYNNMPYDLNYKNLTLEDVFLMTKKKLEQLLEQNKLSKSSYNALVSSWNCHLNKLAKSKILEIKRKDVQNIINNCGVKYTGRNYIKILFSKIIDYAVHDLELSIDTSICNVDIGDKEKSTLHKPFTDEEVHVIMEYAKTNKIARLLMIYFYTGLRPSELLEIKNDKVFLDKDYMIGGIKTDAGIDRIIPIHSKIKNYIIELYNTNNKYLIINEITNSKMSYDAYQKRFDKLISDLGMSHTPHDTRHTFATKCDGIISDVNIKILMGHSLAADVTNDVYIHKTAEKLKIEIEKINY